MYDDKLTQDLQSWLAAESHDSASIIHGAELVLKLNRNVSMYQTIIRRPLKFESKVRYELNKFLPMRLERMTLQDVKALDAEVTPEVKEAIDEEQQFMTDNKEEEAAEDSEDSDAPADMSFLPRASGIRPDHDKLPADVRSIWQQNKERWNNIKRLYMTLLPLTQPCDRYEYLQQLKETWYTYKREIERYDNYVAPSDSEVAADDAAPSPVDIAKDISNARSYITKYIDRLVELRRSSLSADDNTKALADYNNLLAKVQQRVTVLLENAAPIGDDILAKLNEAGLSLPSAE